jgi:hypothetical protein
MKKVFELKAGFQSRSKKKVLRSVCPIRGQIDLMLLARKFLSKDPARHPLHNFLVEQREGGSLMVATDGRKAIQVELNVVIEPGLYRPLVMNKSEIVLIEADECNNYPKGWREVFPTAEGFSFDAGSADQIMYVCARLGVHLSRNNMPLEKGKVYPRTNVDPVLIVGESWQAVIMPMRFDHDSAVDKLEAELRRKMGV